MDPFDKNTALAYIMAWRQTDLDGGLAWWQIYASLGLNRLID